MPKKLKASDEETAEVLGTNWAGYQFEDRAYKVTFKHGTATEVQGHVMAQAIPFPLADIAAIEPVEVFEVPGEPVAA
jgi:hypothetical protein